MEMDDNKRRRNMILYVLIAFVVYLVLSTVLFPNIGHTQQITETDYSTFVKALDKKSVEKVEYNTDDYTIYYTKKGEDENIAYKTTGVPNDAGFTDRVLESGASLESVVPDKNSGLMTYYLLTLILPMAIFFLIGWWLNRRMKKAMGDDGPSMNFGGGGFGGGGLGKSGARVIASKDVGVTFKDVAGQEEAKESLKEVVDFLEKPQRYEEIGAKLPRGALLVGPPGTGKTLLAKAVAGEAGVPFFSISGSDFVEMFVGVGASRVRDLFKDAKEASPAIIFIDEIDAVGRQRGTGLGGGHDEREQTLNQLLVEMDGFESNDSVVLIAATNRADVLDPALLRPGRFDRQIVVDTPDVKGRQRILEVHSKDKPIGSDVDLAKIAKITPGFTGADLANLMNESALLTARRGKKIITMREVSESMERVIAGPERKGRVMNEKTKHTIAYHESGHALVGHLLDHADPVHKISIISRGRALGYTLSIPDEDKVLNSLSEMKDELAVFMGGRVAEEIFCDDITTGASNDLERASKMARAIVTQYGMSPLGTQVFGQPNHEVFLGRDYGNTQDYSEETARRIDEEVAKIMKEAHDRAHAILSSHADQMDLMASVLLERETVEGEACEALLDNKWDEYLAREDDIIAAKEAEEAAARAKDAELLAAQGEGDGASDTPGAPGAAPADPDAGETLADPNWRNEPVEPGDQDPNAPFRTPAEHADRADAPTQAEVNAEIDREDDMDSSADAPDPNKKD